MDTEKTPQELIVERVQSLPPSVRRAIAGLNIAQTIGTIAQRHRIHLDKIPAIENNVALVVLGELEPAEFVANLVDEAGVPEEEALAITKEVNDKVFEVIRAAEKEASRPTQAPTPNRAPVPSGETIPIKTTPLQKFTGMPKGPGEAPRPATTPSQAPGAKVPQTAAVPSQAPRPVRVEVAKPQQPLDQRPAAAQGPKPQVPLQVQPTAQPLAPKETPVKLPGQDKVFVPPSPQPVATKQPEGVVAAPTPPPKTPVPQVASPSVGESAAREEDDIVAMKLRGVVSGTPQAKQTGTEEERPSIDPYREPVE